MTSTNSEFIEKLMQRSHNYQDEPFSTINCLFEEQFDPNYSFTNGTWSTFDDLSLYHLTLNIRVIAARDMDSTEELLIFYKKPAPELLI